MRSSHQRIKLETLPTNPGICKVTIGPPQTHHLPSNVRGSLLPSPGLDILPCRSCPQTGSRPPILAKDRGANSAKESRTPAWGARTMQAADGGQAAASG
jgi:hypothetical protein